MFLNPVFHAGGQNALGKALQAALIHGRGLGGYLVTAFDSDGTPGGQPRLAYCS